MGVAILLLGIALFWLAPTRGGRYQAQSRVIAMLCTNAVFGRSFESRVVQRVPGVIGLRVYTSFSTRPTPTTPGLTNGAGMDIVVLGETSAEAQRLANEAAVTLCATVRQLYGGTASVVDLANGARPYSYFHETLELKVARLFKP